MNGHAPCGRSIEEAVVKLQNRVGSRVRGLRVVIEDRHIILHGRAPTYHAKQLVQHAAMAILGLPILANRIEVQAPESG
jgi:hypothetical protein